MKFPTTGADQLGDAVGPSRLLRARRVSRLTACGNAKPYPYAVKPAPSANSRAVGVTVHLGSDPRLAPVERLLSASRKTFNAGLFLSAFDVSAQPCNITAIARRVDGHVSQSSVDPGTSRLVSVTSRGAIGSVKLADPNPFYIRIRHAHNEWIVDENACMRIAADDGADLPDTMTNGLTELAPGDPRRAPATALIKSLSGRFSPTTFVTVFDLSDQPCDVPGLARSVANEPTAADPSNPTPRYFLRPIGTGVAGVVATAEGSALPMRIRQVGGHWRLDENVCTWLTLLVFGQHAAQDRGVRSDLRNALTAEKTIYTDAQMYSASPTTMREIEPDLDWGNRLQINIADVNPGDRNVVCLGESSPSGNTYAIADVASGPLAGTYYGAKPCPSPLNVGSAYALGSSFG